MKVSTEVRSQGTLLAKACDASPLNEEAALGAIATLGSTGSLAAIPYLLPALAAPTWAVGVLGRPRARARNLGLARAAAEAVADLLAGRSTSDLVRLDRSVRLVSTYHRYASEFWRQWFVLEPDSTSILREGLG